jgi:SAM-dependent methyltransferase
MAAAKEFSTSEHDWESQDYVDEWIRRDTQKDEPRRAHLREMLAHAPVRAADELCVLDVGGGFGVATEEVLRAFPRALVTLQDYSEPMLGHARARLGHHGDRVRCVLADLCDPSWVDRVGGPFDLAVSSIAIHNLRDTTLIGACCRGIAGLLKAGAVFLNYDLVDHMGGVAAHLDLMRRAGFSRVECLWYGAPAAIIAGFVVDKT